LWKDQKNNNSLGRAIHYCVTASTADPGRVSSRFALPGVLSSHFGALAILYCSVCGPDDIPKQRKFPILFLNFPVPALEIPCSLRREFREKAPKSLG
jgi:hypothetical protein